MVCAVIAQVAVALGPSVYMWSASTGTICQLMSTNTEDDYITSLAWAKDGKHIAVGTYSSQVCVVNTGWRLFCIAISAVYVMSASSNAMLMPNRMFIAQDLHRQVQGKRLQSEGCFRITLNRSAGMTAHYV